VNTIKFVVHIRLKTHKFDMAIFFFFIIIIILCIVIYCLFLSCRSLDMGIFIQGWWLGFQFLGFSTHLEHYGSGWLVTGYGFDPLRFLDLIYFQVGFF
jgi:hypothetical protein